MCVCVCVCVYLEWNLEHNTPENVIIIVIIIIIPTYYKRGVFCYSSQEENQLHSSNPGHICRLISVGSLTYNPSLCFVILTIVKPRTPVQKNILPKQSSWATSPSIVVDLLSLPI